MFYHITDQATCLASPGGGLAVDFVGRVERVDEDMAAAVQLINGRLPPGGWGGAGGGGALRGR
jgi:hypothetical protein